VGGENVRTHCLVAPGADPHTFEPRPSDVRLLAEADILVVNGLNLEPSVLKLAASCGFKGRIVVAANGISPRAGSKCQDHEDENDRHGHSPESRPHGHGVPAANADPHVWQDPRNVSTFVSNIQDALAAAAPAQAEEYRRRAAAYQAELVELDKWIRAEVATIPAGQRRLVTSHDSLGYFAAAYGFETVPVAGLSTAAEPDARTLAGIVDTIRAGHVTAVFIELTSNPKLLRQIAGDAGVRLADPLYTDSTGPAGSGAETYIGLIRTNVSRIVSALR
jgi:zinc/manganese transport system substrate-binding protein